jgi:adenine-specific DNA-methyltransferase
MVVHAENLRALRVLGSRFEHAFRCVYLDPPFNSGRTFAEYRDAREPSVWRAMMEERLVAIRPLVAHDGAVFVEIDDTELGALQCLMDEIFGRDNRVSTVTVVRSAPVGHKAINRGPVNVTDFLLVYAKDKAEWRPTPLTRARRDYDGAYSTFLTNREQVPARWRFEPLRRTVARALGYPSSAAAGRALGRETFLRETERFALANAESVVRFAQPRYEAVSRRAREQIDRSRAEPERVIVMERVAHAPMILRGGNRLLFLSDKVEMVGGARVLTEPLTNVWDDVPFQGIAKEGGVVFSRNKKPERLLARILAMATRPGDWVLDPFLGSGTTAAVAHKMGRRWVGIEEGDHARDLCVPRLSRVVDGADATGMSRALEWQGGGGFGIFV